jgi:putative ABC transport system permease protein
LFQTVELRLIKGKWLSESEVRTAQHVGVITQRLARDFFGDADPIGQQVKIKAFKDPIQPPHDAEFQIIGVVADVKQRGLGTEQGPTIYRTYYQSMARYTFVLVRTRPNPLSMAAVVKDTIASVDRSLALGAVQTLDQQLAQSVSTQRFSMTLLALFGGLALGLAAIGVYGVAAYTAAHRTREIGVRMAMGARPADILKLVVGEGLRTCLAGVLAGILSAFVLTRVMRNLLYGVSATDPLTFLAVSAVLVSVALAACYIPAQRAARVDPMAALRHE